MKKKHYGLLFFSESTFMRKYFLSNTFDGLCSITPVQLQESRIIWFIVICNKKMEIINILNKDIRIFVLFKLKNKTVSCFYHKVFVLSIEKKETYLSTTRYKKSEIPTLSSIAVKKN